MDNDYYKKIEKYVANTVMKEMRSDAEFFKMGDVRQDEPDASICRRIQSELDEKLLHSYGGCDEIWLCVYAHHCTIVDFEKSVC